MIVDGKEIARQIYQEISNTVTHLDFKPHLTVFTCAPNFETQKFLYLKRKKAMELGLGINVIEFPENIKTEEVVQSVMYAQMQTDGIVIQLPFPKGVDVDTILNEIPKSLDVDAAHFDGAGSDILPPVVGAIEAIAKRHGIFFAASKVAVVGAGRLVGRPAALWAKKMGAEVVVLTEESKDFKEKLSEARIIISGAGVPGLITPECVREGAVIFDAGTSEDGGVLKGDVSKECESKVSLFTPVPGGIGPITIAILLQNLVKLSLDR